MVARQLFEPEHRVSDRMRKPASKRPLQLADLYELCDRYVPLTSRHPTSRALSTHDTWWPSHELGHLLTVPRARIGEPKFGMITDHHFDTRWWAYELAAMHVSQRLLVACGRPDLFFGRGGELEATVPSLLANANRALAQQILRRRRVLSVPETRAGLEEKLASRTRRVGAGLHVGSPIRGSVASSAPAGPVRLA